MRELYAQGAASRAKADNTSPPTPAFDAADVVWEPSGAVVLPSGALVKGVRTRVTVQSGVREKFGRVSVNPDDAGYRPDHALFEVFLDGVKLWDCVTADDVTGEVWCYGLWAGQAVPVTHRKGHVELRRK